MERKAKQYKNQEHKASLSPDRQQQQNLSNFSENEMGRFLESPDIELTPEKILSLQRTHGNQFVQRLIDSQNHQKTGAQKSPLFLKPTNPKTREIDENGLQEGDEIEFRESRASHDIAQRTANGNTIQPTPSLSSNNNRLQRTPETEGSQSETEEMWQMESDTMDFLQTERFDERPSISAQNSLMGGTLKTNADLGENYTRSGIQSPESNLVQRDDSPGKSIGGSFAKGIFDATLGAGFFAWRDWHKDLNDDEAREHDDIVYGTGKVADFFWILDKWTDALKAMVGTLTSLGVITGFLSLWPVVAPVTAPLAASFGLLATIGHGMAAILKSVMLARDLYRLHTLKDRWQLDSKGYLELKKKAWEDGASVLGSILGFISGAAFGAFDPAGTTKTIMELSGKGAGKAAAGIGAAAGTAQAFGTGGDVLGGGSEVVGQTLYGGGDKEDEMITIPAEVLAEWEAELLELSGMTESTLEDDSSDVGQLQETIDLAGSGMLEVDDNLGRLMGNIEKGKDEVEVANDQADKIVDVAENGKATESEPTAEELEKVEEQLGEAEEQLDLPDGEDFTLTVTDETGKTTTLVEPEIAEEAPPKATFGPETIDEIPIGPIGEEDDKIASRRADLQSMPQSSGKTLIQRGIGSKIKKKFGSIKKWMVKKFANFSKRIQRIVTKIKGKLTSVVMKALGMDTKIVEMQENLSADKEMLPTTKATGEGASEAIEQAEEMIPAIKEAFESKKE